MTALHLRERYLQLLIRWLCVLWRRWDRNCTSSLSTARRPITIVCSLGAGYSNRFERLGGLGDLEDAITSKKQAVALTAVSERLERVICGGSKFSAALETHGNSKNS